MLMVGVINASLFCATSSYIGITGLTGYSLTIHGGEMLGVCEKHGCNYEHRGKGFYCPECEKETQKMFVEALGVMPTR